MHTSSSGYFRNKPSDQPRTTHLLGTKQSTFNPGRFYSTPKRRLQLSTKGILKNTGVSGITIPHDYKAYPTRLKKKENAIEVAAYPIVKEKELDVYYPYVNEEGKAFVPDGIQNMGRKSHRDITRDNFPLVPPTAPRLNLSRVNFHKQFFNKDYRVNNYDHRDVFYKGYDKKPTKIDERFLEEGEEEEIRYHDEPVNKNNFAPRGTRDFNRLLSHRAPIIHDSHGVHHDKKNPNAPTMYSNMNYGDKRTV